MGADGIMVEVHPRPDEALSDAEQSAGLRDVRRDDERAHRRPRARQGPPRRPRSRDGGASAPNGAVTTRDAPARRRATTLGRRRSSCDPPRACAGTPAPPGRQVDLAPGPPARAARARARAGSRRPATARTSARRRASSRPSGATVERVAERDGRVDYRVVSPGGDALVGARGHPRLRQLRHDGPPRRRACSPGATLFAVLDGDASLRRRPMGRVVEPLRADGRASSRAAAAATLLPLAITGRARLTPITLRHAGPERPGQVRDPARRPRGRRRDARSPRRSRPATTPSGCSARAASPSTRATGARRRGTRCASPGRGRGRDRRDRARPTPRRAAFWLVAASIHPDAELRLDGVSTNPTRRAIIDILRRMGADIEEHDRPATGRRGRRAARRPRRAIGAAPGRRPRRPPTWRRRSTRSRSSRLAAAAATGTTRFRGAGELRHKESDRIAGIAAGLGGARRGRARRGRRHRDPRWPAAWRAPSPRPTTITGSR